MHNRAWLTLAIVAFGCGGQRLADIASPTLTIDYDHRSLPDGGIIRSMRLVVGSQDLACPELDGITGSVDGTPMTVTNHGGVDHGGDSDYCNPVELELPLPPAGNRPQTTTISVADSSKSLQMEVLDLFTQRSATFTPAGTTLHLGETITLGWDDPNDDYPTTMFDIYGRPTAGTQDDCNRQVEPQMKITDGVCAPSTLDARSVTFTVPVSAPLGPTSLIWSALWHAHPHVSACTAAICSVAWAAYWPDLNVTIAP